MAKPAITHLLLDFFGTIVDYSASRTEQDYSRSYALVRQSGATLAYGEFLALGDEVFGGFDARSATDLSEFSMHDAAAMILDRALGRPAAGTETDAFVDAYLHDWNAAVLYPAGMAELLQELAGQYRLALVSNTHSRTLVPDHLAAMGFAGLFDTVVLSTSSAWMRPRPCSSATPTRPTTSVRSGRASPPGSLIRRFSRRSPTMIG